MTGWYNSSWRARFLEYRKEGDGWSHPLLLCDKTHRRRTMMSGDDRQNSPSISRQNRPSATAGLRLPHSKQPAYSSSTSQSPSRFSCLQLLKLIFFSKSSESSEGFEKKGGEAPLLLCAISEALSSLLRRLPFYGRGHRRLPRCHPHGPFFSPIFFVCTLKLHSK